MVIFMDFRKQVVMNQERVSELFTLLNAEFNKTPVNNKRVAEICHYIGEEYKKAKPTASWWSNFFGWLTGWLPPDWKTYVTAAIALALSLNTQFHWVSTDVQNALLSIAVVFGFWTVHATQAQIKKRLGMKK